MTIDEIIRLLNDAENELLRRLRTTADPSEKRTLTEEIARVRVMRDRANMGALLDHAAALNDLAGVIENAAAALRQRPFDATLGGYQGLLDRVGALTGEMLRLEHLAAEPGAPEIESAGVDPKETLVQMFEACEVRPERLAEIDGFYVRPLTRGRAIYEQVGARLGIPWWFIGLIHGLEASFSFETHLHNGDPLTARTFRHPPGRPATGSPPFTWLESAVDALTLERLDGLTDWSLGAALDRLERYNGLGYRNRGLPSPYLWSFSNQYLKGKFVADGKFDPEATSRQCGAATLLKRLADLGIVDLNAPMDAGAGSVAALRAATAAPDMPVTPQVPKFMEATVRKELSFPGEIAKGRVDKAGKLDVHRVQEWCCFHGSVTSIDGDFGGGTQNAVRGLQRTLGLEPTGVVDERCWAAMTAPMHRALAPVRVEDAETIYEVTLKVARQHLAEHPIEFTSEGEGNKGPWVRLYMLGNEGDAQPWCAGFVSHVLAQAAFAMGDKAPIPRQVGVDAIVKDAKRDGRFLDGKTLQTATERVVKIRKGSLFVVRRNSRDWTHVGFVTEAAGDHFTTIEGNTNDEGSRDGFEVCARSRGYGKRDFVLLV